MACGTLVICRPVFEDGGRAYRILVDGRKVGRIKPYEELRVDLYEGQHQLVARIDWARSNFLSFDVRDSETIEVEVGSNVRGVRMFAALYFATIGCRNWLFTRIRVVGFPVQQPRPVPAASETL